MAEQTTTKRPTKATTPATPKPESPAARVRHESLVAALAAFQAEVPTIRKGNTAQVRSDKGSYSYDYADLSDVTEKALPLLGRHGLSFTAKPTLHDGSFVLIYELRHELGETDMGVYPLPNPNTPAQQMGSAITYARRYVLCAVTGIAPGGDDDDAGAIQQHQYEQQRPPQPRQQRPAQQRPEPAGEENLAKAIADATARAEAATSPQALQEMWQTARGAGAPTAVLDAIATVGQRRKAEAQAQLQEQPEEPPTEPEDPEAAEAAAIAAHEAELDDTVLESQA